MADMLHHGQPVEKVITSQEETIMRGKTSRLKRRFHLRAESSFPEVWRRNDKLPEKKTKSHIKESHCNGIAYLCEISLPRVSRQSVTVSHLF